MTEALPPGDTQVVSAGTYDEILSTAESSFCILDLAGKTLYASPNTLAVLGVPPEALVGCAAPSRCVMPRKVLMRVCHLSHTQAKRAVGGDPP